MLPEVLFKAVADATRQRTLAVLRRTELSVSELVEVLRQPQSTVSRHLRILREAGLIRDRRNGNTVLYSVPSQNDNADRPPLAERVLEWIAEQPLSTSLESRLRSVIQEREDMSRRFFDRVGRRWDSLREESFGNRFHLEALIALLPSAWTVADIGTGTGYLLPALARHFDRIIAVEPVGTMLEAARHRIERHGIANVLLRGGDLSRLPIEEGAVDVAIAVLVLHHVATPRDALTELCRIVRPGGKVLIVEQTAHQDEAFRERMQDRWWGFDPDKLGESLRSVGFDEVQARRLATVERADNAPDLFVVTGCKVVGTRTEKRM